MAPLNDVRRKRKLCEVKMSVRCRQKVSRRRRTVNYDRNQEEDERNHNFYTTRRGRKEINFMEMNGAHRPSSLIMTVIKFPTVN